MRRWARISCAGALLLGAVACSDDDTTSTSDESSTTTESTTSTTQPAPDGRLDVVEQFEEGPLEPGGYYIDPDGDRDTSLRVTYDVPAEGWSPWYGAVKLYDTGHVGITITTVTNVVREGCTDHRPADPAVGPTVDDLALALSELSPFEVSTPPSEVTMFGYTGQHLQLTVPDIPVARNESDRYFTECDEQELHSWFSTNLGGSFWAYNGEPGRTEDFWILDVDGTRLVIETNSSPETSASDRAEAQAILDSIQIEA